MQKKHHRSLVPVLSVAALTGLAFPAHAQSYDFVADYFAPGYTSQTNGQRGAWSSGSESRLTGGVTEIPDAATFLLGPGWAAIANPLDAVGAVEHNPTGSPAVVGSQTWQPGTASIHAFSDGSYEGVRWIAPAAGTIDVSSLFYDGDVNASTDVHVLHNSTSLFDAFKNGGGPDQSFTDVLTVNANDTIDFMVGYGANHNYGYDDNGFEATIRLSPSGPAAVPEPGSYQTAVLLTVGGLFLLRRRRK